MKKLIRIFLTVCLTLSSASCGGKDKDLPKETPESTLPITLPKETDRPDNVSPEIQEEPFEGKIAIITGYDDWGGAEYRTALQIVEKYGEDKLIHKIWPDGYMNEPERMLEIVTELGDDPDVKVIIVAPAVYGTDTVFEKLQESLEDKFVVFCNPIWGDYNSADIIVQLADLLLMSDEVGMGAAMVQQAQKLGAETFVYYSFPDYSKRYRTAPIYAARYELMKVKCEEFGIKFVDSDIKEPSNINNTNRYEIYQKLLLDDFKNMVTKYGIDTAFFNANNYYYIHLTSAVISCKAILPQPLNHDPFYGIAVSLGLWYEQEDDTILARVKASLEEQNMTGRISAAPVEESSVCVRAGVEYAIKWLNGEVSKEGVDVPVLKQLMEDCTGVEVFLTPYVDEYPYVKEGEETGETYDNYFFWRMDYITY